MNTPFFPICKVVMSTSTCSGSNLFVTVNPKHEPVIAYQNVLATSADNAVSASITKENYRKARARGIHHIISSLPIRHEKTSLVFRANKIDAEDVSAVSSVNRGRCAV